MRIPKGKARLAITIDESLADALKHFALDHKTRHEDLLVELLAPALRAMRAGSVNSSTPIEGMAADLVERLKREHMAEDAAEYLLKPVDEAPAAGQAGDTRPEHRIRPTTWDGYRFENGEQLTMSSDGWAECPYCSTSVAPPHWGKYVVTLEPGLDEAITSRADQANADAGTYISDLVRHDAWQTIKRGLTGKPVGRPPKDPADKAQRRSRAKPPAGGPKWNEDWSKYE